MTSPDKPPPSHHIAFWQDSYQLEKCPYKTLGLDKTSPFITDKDIESAFRKLSLKCHPDKIIHKPEAEKKTLENMFRQITIAKETLKDEDARANYDDNLYLVDLRQSLGATTSQASARAPPPTFGTGAPHEQYYSQWGPGSSFTQQADNYGAPPPPPTQRHAYRPNIPVVQRVSRDDPPQNPHKANIPQAQKVSQDDPPSTRWCDCGGATGHALHSWSEPHCMKWINANPGWKSSIPPPGGPPPRAGTMPSPSPSVDCHCSRPDKKGRHTFHGGRNKCGSHPAAPPPPPPKKTEQPPPPSPSPSVDCFCNRRDKNSKHKWNHKRDKCPKDPVPQPKKNTEEAPPRKAEKAPEPAKEPEKSPRVDCHCTRKNRTHTHNREKCPREPVPPPKKKAPEEPAPEGKAAAQEQHNPPRTPKERADTTPDHTLPPLPPGRKYCICDDRRPEKRGPDGEKIPHTHNGGKEWFKEYKPRAGSSPSPSHPPRTPRGRRDRKGSVSNVTLFGVQFNGSR